MIGLVLVTHGRLAAEFITAMEHVVGPQEAVEGICIDADDDPNRIAINHINSPLLGRRQKLSDGGVRLHWRASPVGGGGSRNGGAVARSGFFPECPPSRPPVAAERYD